MNLSATKIGTVIAVILLGLVYVSPNFMNSDFQSRLPAWLQPMLLGLDLRGGSYLLLEVDVDAVAKEQMTDLEETVRALLREPRVPFRNLRTAGNAVFVTINDAAQVPGARTTLVANLAGLLIEVEEESRLKITVPDTVLRERQASAIDQSIEIVRRRVDEFGTSEANVQRQGADRIMVELPGLDNPARVKALIGQTARMNFHLVEPGVGALSGPQDLPAGTMIVQGAGDDTQSYVVRRRVEVAGDRLVDAQPTFQNGQPIVSFRFDTAGGRRFGQITSANVGNRLAILLDDRVISAPVINGPIVGGSGIIEGGFTVESARDLALLLRAGALPAPLVILEERSIGPSLGADSIRDGQIASIAGGILVTLFMVLSYFTFGVLAMVAMTVNIMLLLAVLSAVGATLTLPGIAGIVLTLGMSVDSNVLIYERMREEFLSGRTILNSLNAGFSQAWSAILDSNITQLISGILMFTLGSGPIRGFAVTLTIGIFTSLFATTWVTRSLIIMWFRSGKRTMLPI